MDIRRKISIFFTLLREWIIWSSPLWLFFGITALFIYLFKIQRSDALEIMRIFIWPISILTALYFFRRVFTYMFLSLEEFNFFGTKGRLKPVEEVIAEKAQRLHDDNRKKEKQKKYIEKIKSEREELEELFKTVGEQGSKWEELARRAEKGYSELTEKYSALVREHAQIITKDHYRKAFEAAIKKKIREGTLKKSSPEQGQPPIPEINEENSG